MNKPVVLITAAAILGVAAYCIFSRRPAAVAVSPAAALPSSPTVSASAKPASVNPVQPSATKPPDARSLIGPELQLDAPNAPSEPRSTQAQPPLQKDKQAMAACRAMWDDQAQRKQAAHDAETKDPAWAYDMEQKLREYASPRLQAIAIELVEVDCKTTFCDLTARGFAPASVKEFSNALEALKEQPWSDFTGRSASQSSDAGKVTYTAELRRQRSYETPFQTEGNSEAGLACARLMTQRARQQRATRDAEPRDAAWADQMEQLLRQHITSGLVKHPVEQLQVDCRTTFCRIKASGTTRESLLVFQQVCRDAAAEPWANLRAGESGNSGYGDSWTSETTLYREMTGSRAEARPTGQ